MTAKIFAAFAFSLSGALISLPNPVLAESWQTETNDTRLTQAELTALVLGKTMTYDGGGKSVFDTDGGYEFYVGGEVYLYTYQITNDGEVCIASADFGARCDLIVVNDGQVISINDQGERFPASIE
jgi:hypothetical protein